jgi:NAD(P)H-dependent FMN reductase
MKKILAISGSLRAQSSNTALLLAAQSLVPSGCEIHFFQGLDVLPHFNPDREGETIPALDHWRDEIRKSDALLICSPEYAHGIPGTLKNAFDWIVGTNELDKKPIGIINATPMYESKSYAQEALIEVLKTMSGTITPDTVLGVHQVKSKLKDNKLIDEPTARAVQKLLENLLRLT